MHRKTPRRRSSLGSMGRPKQEDDWLIMWVGHFLIPFRWQTYKKPCQYRWHRREQPHKNREGEKSSKLHLLPPHCLYPLLPWSIGYRLYLAANHSTPISVYHQSPCQGDYRSVQQTHSMGLYSSGFSKGNFSCGNHGKRTLSTKREHHFAQTTSCASPSCMARQFKNLSFQNSSCR